jgi:hypothetical protein
MRKTSLTRLAAMTVLGLVFCLPALSQQREPVLGPLGPAPSAAAPAFDRDRDGLRDVLRCLRVLDLTDAQKAAIQQFLDTEKPTLQALHDTLKADRQILLADASTTPPDPCKVGTDFLAVRADRQAIHAEIEKIKDFIGSQLTDVQKARFEGCIRATLADPAG